MLHTATTNNYVPYVTLEPMALVLHHHLAQHRTETTRPTRHSTGIYDAGNESLEGNIPVLGSPAGGLANLAAMKLSDISKPGQQYAIYHINTHESSQQEHYKAASCGLAGVSGKSSEFCPAGALNCPKRQQKSHPSQEKEDRVAPPPAMVSMTQKQTTTPPFGKHHPPPLSSSRKKSCVAAALATKKTFT